MSRKTYSIVVCVPGDEIATICAIEAVRQAALNFKHTLVFDFKVRDTELVEVVKASGLARAVSVIEEDVNLIELGMHYNLVHIVSPTLRQSNQFGEDDKAEKIKEAAKFLQNADAFKDIPSIPFNYLSTICQNLHQQLTELDASWKFSAQEARPYLQTSRAARETIKKLLRTEIKAQDGELVGTDGFVVIVANPDDAWVELADVIDFPTVIVTRNGTIGDRKFSVLEQIALVENNNCLCVISNEWLRYAAWAFNKRLFIDIINGDPDWKSVRDKHSVIWNTKTRSLPELKTLLQEFLEFHLRELL